MEPIYLTDLRVGANDDINDNLLQENAVRPLSEFFQVSAEAMRITAEGVGLLLEKREPSLFD